MNKRDVRLRCKKIKAEHMEKIGWGEDCGCSERPEFKTICNIVSITCSLLHMSGKLFSCDITIKIYTKYNFHQSVVRYTLHNKTHL